MVEATLQLAVGLAAGAALGAVYFLGLWWTLRRLPGARRPGLRLLASFTLRGALVVAAFAALARWGALALVVALGGFLLARLAVTRALGPAAGGGSA